MGAAFVWRKRQRQREAYASWLQRSRRWENDAFNLSPREFKKIYGRAAHEFNPHDNDDVWHLSGHDFDAMYKQYCEVCRLLLNLRPMQTAARSQPASA